MPNICFSYFSGAPQGARDLPGIPVGGGGVMGYPCFSYLAGMPLGITDRVAAARAVSDLRRTPDGTTTACFSYRPDGSPTACFSYGPSGNPTGCFKY